MMIDEEKEELSEFIRIQNFLFNNINSKYWDYIVEYLSDIDIFFNFSNYKC